MKDYYKILGVDENVSSDELKKVYRTKAKQHHPDTAGGDNTLFQEINEAYQTLSDDQKRAEYDQMKKYGGNFGGQQHHGNPFGGSPFGFNFGAGFGPGGPGFGFDFGNLEEMLRRQNGYSRPQRNQDVNAQYNISLEDAYHGGEKDLQLNTNTGLKNIKVKIPAGVETGMRLKISGMGDHNLTNLPPGDLYLHVVVGPHPKYQREGQNLRMKTTITSIDAMLGTELTIHSLDGNEIKVKVPAGIQYGNSLRVQGKGMPIHNRVSHGDLYVDIHIETSKLNSEQMEILRKIKK